jgi:hypothetical protein
LIAKIISNEVDIFMDREKSDINQKNLKQLEKEIDIILQEDPRVGHLLLPIRRNENRDHSQPHAQISN